MNWKEVEECVRDHC